ncbi:major facilitator superfamily domain-containing protein [Leptodontidium sp. 2 PMI_412]|nr:major facilitator superfamily domain-containing protein [Leptodontidium sp. 2 PMI_412]
MPLGILEPKTTPGHHVPGTVLLDAHATSEEGNLELAAAGLKKGSGKNSEVILVPQPSSDPNDPLNWPLWQRDLILMLYCFCTLCCVGGGGPILSSMAIPLITEFKITFQQVSLLSGYQLCAVGAIGLVVSACARKFGRRPTFLWSISAAFSGTVWGSRSNSFGSMCGARVVQGLGIAMFESVTYSLIGDMYHVHQRGTRMTAYILFQSGLGQIPSVIAGKITMDLGWRWVFYLLAIFMGIGWIGAVLFGWETLYIRNSAYNLDTSSTGQLDNVQATKSEGSVQEQRVERTATVSTTGARTRETVLQRMRPFHGTFTEEPLWELIIKPFWVLLNPIVLWSVILVAFTTVWVVIISFTIAQAFYGPPYFLTVAQQGYMGAGPVVGGFLGCIACGLICDPLARYLAKRNHGKFHSNFIYEPEFRLPMMIFVPIVSGLGYFLFGNLIEQGQTPVAASVMFGLVFVSVQFTAVSTGAYIVDAFRDISVEVFIISMTFKNFIFFNAWLDFLNDWYANAGPAVMFDTIGGIQIGLSLTTIPIYIYGKMIRAWWHSHDIFGAK